MRLSGHFEAFEGDAKVWIDRLAMLQACAEVWVNVQRRWVYLEGIFLGASDIAQQLPAEHAKFRSIDNDFISLMKKTAARMRVMDVLANVANLLKSLQLLYDALEKVQKALAEYLETQRQAFGRFYFVGDEDLLEIIGNSRELASVQKYFSKMFAGISFVESGEEGQLLCGFRSRENEGVGFVEPFRLGAKPRVNEWLGQVEAQMQRSVAAESAECARAWHALAGSDVRELVARFPAQAVLLGFQAEWTFSVEDGKLPAVEQRLVAVLEFLAEEVLTDLPKLTRAKYEQLITEFVHKRDVTRRLMTLPSLNRDSFDWTAQLRFYLDERGAQARMGNADFAYGFEYLGVAERLVQTPLTDRCFFTLTQALWLRMGGAPFGPAGTGKTESVKALGSVLGRFVLVFNCDETFNTKAMGRIFIGLCQVGAWGCFDEFNRLEERILSAVSQDILTIQTGLREKAGRVEVIGRAVRLNDNMGIFVTMNPGYAGRSNLPENLKQLFRQMAMVRPDRELIAQVMLFSQGFRHAEGLSGKVVALFELCADQLSSQPHYDFGLRALKSVLNSAGAIKRQAITDDKAAANQPLAEQRIILRSFCDTVVPKLVAEDVPLLDTLVQGVFPGTELPRVTESRLRTALSEECRHRQLLEGEGFIAKVLQLHQIMRLQHGVMLVGPTGCGKTTAWRTLLSALGRLEQGKGEFYVIDPKALSKEELYGRLDPTTLEWTDGIFTHILRRIVDGARGDNSKRHWIVFDGDVDPEWAENLNSVLDDNKLLTLPNGDRLSVPGNVRLLFEVESLRHATLATVSRCGMVWFAEEALRPQELFYHYLMRLRADDFDRPTAKAPAPDRIRDVLVKKLEPFFFGRPLEEVMDNGRLLPDAVNGFALLALEMARKREHVMEFSVIRVTEALFSLLRRSIDDALEQAAASGVDEAVLGRYLLKWTLLAINWAFVGDLKLNQRADYFAELQRTHGNVLQRLVDLPPLTDRLTLIDFVPEPKRGEWVAWQQRVPETIVDEKQLSAADLVIPTVDTLRHQAVLCAWLMCRRPFIICGPPGSGKTMTLMSTLRSLSDYDMVFVNFSASTTPALILKQFEHHCETVKTSTGLVLRPRAHNRSLVVFCDEINLPDEDRYGTQIVITFLRQLLEQRGFWRAADRQWVSLERVQFVGACNPPTDAGRHPLAPRFLRHCPLVLVDFPGHLSLLQIYGTFNRAMLAPRPELHAHAQSLTQAMVEYYTRSQRRFTADQQPHYVYSPRELTRWKHAMHQALPGVADVDGLVRLWAHEALRLFEDRLVNAEEKDWCQRELDNVAREFFPGLGATALTRPLLFSAYLSRDYSSVTLDALRDYVSAKLRTFSEEKFTVQLVVFDAMLEHIARIDRVLRQPLGHLLLVGASGVGKTTLSRFVAWMNGLEVFQIKAGRNFGLIEFDANLRDVMKRAGCKQQKICFIFDESNALGVAFLERMNALLAAGEVPGLFEGDELAALIHAYKEANPRDRNQTDAEVYASFTRQVQRNLHVVFTMNPASPDFSNRAASSPAIFNRCVIDWFGDWDEETLHHVAHELTERVEVAATALESKELSPHDILAALVVKVHRCVVRLNAQLQRATKRHNFVTPRDFLSFLQHFSSLHTAKAEVLAEQQGHLSSGLAKLRETEEKAAELAASLAIFHAELDTKQRAADEKMAMMLKKKEEALAEREKMTAANEQLTLKRAEIEERRAAVQVELAEVEPAVRGAREAVSHITTKEISDMRVLNNPPEAIKLTLTAVVMLIENKSVIPSWKEIQTAMKGKDFTDNIRSLDVDEVSEGARRALNKEIAPKMNIDKIRSAYAAAGFMADWVLAQLRYAEIIKRVDPLRAEIKHLQKDLDELVNEQTVLVVNLEQIEQNIEEFKQQFSSLTGEIQRLKTEMSGINTKVDTSARLLGNLGAEKERWSESERGYSQLLDCLVGDVLLSSGFLAYCGFFDQLYRGLLMRSWQQMLRDDGLKFRVELAVTEYLSTPAERVLWAAHRLPADELCSQNAVILKHHSRYPLVIDPSGQAVEFLFSLHRDRRAEKTTFEDSAFLKTLEKCLRFGLPLLVENVVRVEPLLNSLLNKEVMRQGGRALVRVGDQEIDFNPNFALFLLARDPNCRFPPDICSRVTFVNFTVTPASLENQCVNLFLRHERPEIEQKRVELLKLQGEYLARVRELEDDLLRKISAQTGNILDDAPLLNTLDTLKVKASEVAEKLQESSHVLEEVNAVIGEYTDLSRLAARVYFSLLLFAQLNSLYEYSFQFYMRILTELMEADEQLKAVERTEPLRRIEVIRDRLFTRLYQKLRPSVLERDKPLFAAKFLQLKLGNRCEDEFKVLYEPERVFGSPLPPALTAKFSPQQQLRLENLSRVRDCRELLRSLESDTSRWLAFATGTDNEPPMQWYTGGDAQRARLIAIGLFRALKPQHCLEKVSVLAREVLGDEFGRIVVTDLGALIAEESEAQSPLFISTAPGFDPATQIEEAARRLNRRIESVAMGAAEGYEVALRLVERAAKAGSWAMIKNVHLATRWLGDKLDGTLQRLKPTADFRLFLLSEFSEKIPPSVLRQSLKLNFELPTGVRPNVLRCLLGLFTPARFEALPSERGRIYFQLVWLHAVVMERLRYVPIGWSKAYEFSEADLRYALEVTDLLLQRPGPPQQHLTALRSIVCQNIYGGKIDNDFDLTVLQSLVGQYLNNKVFDVGQPLLSDQGHVVLQNFTATNYADYVTWVRELTVAESPIWAGLPLSAEEAMQRAQAEELWRKLAVVQDLNEEEVATIQGEDDVQTTRLKWLEALGERCAAYFKTLPAELPSLSRNESLIANPLFRFLEREVKAARNLLLSVRDNLRQVQEMCSGQLQPLPELREMARNIHAGRIPRSWQIYVLPDMDVTAWVHDFAQRIEQLQRLSSTPNWHREGFRLGLMLFPEAFLTSNRQIVAQRNGLSLDELKLSMSLATGKESDEDSFLVSGLTIEGANLTSEGFRAEKGMSFPLPPVKFIWKKSSSDKTVATDDVLVPIYLNNSRKNLVTAVKLQIGKSSLDAQNLYQKGIAIILWNK